MLLGMFPLRNSLPVFNNINSTLPSIPHVEDLRTGLKKTLLIRVREWENRERNHKTVLGVSFRDYSDPEITCIYFPTVFTLKVNWGRR